MVFISLAFLLLLLIDTHSAHEVTYERIDLLENIDATERSKLKDQVKSMFYHAYYGYMVHAFPVDELDALDCTGQPFDPSKVGLVTLIDCK